MIHALTKQIAAVTQEYFNLNNVYASLDESAEFINIANRRLQLIPNFTNQVEFSIFDKPILFVKMKGVKYDEGRSGYRRAQSGYSLLNMQVPQQSLIGTISNNSIVSDTIGSSINTGAVILDKSDMIISSGNAILQPSTMVYVSLKVITVVVEYEIILYNLYTQQSFDLINYFMFLPRTTAIQAIINENIVIDIPVSMLITEVSESTFDFNLSGKGIKVYKVGGTLEALSYLLPMNVSGGQGEAAIINYWTVNNINSILYSPIKKIDLEFIVGGNIENQTIG